MEIKNTCPIGYIYLLIDPNDKSVRYVGQSVRPQKRYKEHLNLNNKHDYNYKENWIRSLQSRNQQPIQQIIYSGPINSLNEIELEYIYFYSNEKLTNYIRDNRYSSTQLKEYKKLQNETIGVSLDKRRNSYSILFKLNNKRCSIGYLSSKIVAQRVYDSVVRYYRKDPITNFPGIGQLSIEQAKKFCNQTNRLQKRGSKYSGVSWSNKNQKFIVELKSIYVSSYNHEKDALLARDQVAKHLGLPTEVHHNCSPITIEEAKIQNGTRLAEQKERLYTGSQADYVRQTTGNVGISFDKRIKKYRVTIYRDGDRHSIGSYTSIRTAQKFYDKVDSGKLTVNEAKYFSRVLDNKKLPGIVYRGASCYFTINYIDNEGKKQKYRSPAMKDKKLCVYYSIAARNYYDLPTNLKVTTDKLSIEQIKDKLK